MSIESHGTAGAAPTKFLIAAGAWALSALVSPIPAAAVTVLDSGQSVIVTPPQTECLTIEVVNPPKALLPVASATCDTATGLADVKASDGESLLDVDAVASSVFLYQFWVQDSGAAAGPSQVPIHVQVPVDWVARLINNHITDSSNNVIGDFGGYASLDIVLQLRQDPALDAATGGSRGTIVERTSILSASHGGLAGCLTIPTDPASLVAASISCALSVAQQLEGSSFTSLSAVVETGRTYNLELLVTARAHSGLTLNPLTASASTHSLFNPDGLRWSRMVVTVGTDPAMLVAGLQNQIDELRKALEGHTHTYLTGKGTGHNNTVAVSSSAILPGGDTGGTTPVAPPPNPAPGPGKGNPKQVRWNIPGNGPQ